MTGTVCNLSNRVQVPFFNGPVQFLTANAKHALVEEGIFRPGVQVARIGESTATLELPQVGQLFGPHLHGFGPDVQVFGELYQGVDVVLGVGLHHPVQDATESFYNLLVGEGLTPGKGADGTEEGVEQLRILQGELSEVHALLAHLGVVEDAFEELFLGPTTHQALVAGHDELFFLVQQFQALGFVHFDGPNLWAVVHACQGVYRPLTPPFLTAVIISAIRRRCGRLGRRRRGLARTTATCSRPGGFDLDCPFLGYLQSALVMSNLSLPILGQLPFQLRRLGPHLLEDFFQGGTVTLF